MVDRDWLSNFWKRKYYESKQWISASIQPYGESSTYGGVAPMAPITVITVESESNISKITGVHNVPNWRGKPYLLPKKKQ